MKLEYEHICYVLLRVNKIHPITEYRHDLIWYPEDAMTLLDSVQYRPYIKSVVTECPWIISTYSIQNVRVWTNRYNKNKFEWERPNRQTYGASVNMITHSLLGIQQTIPSTPLDGGDAIQKLIKKVKGSY